MLQSMTGFGRAESNIEDYNCIIEIRALNGKQLDITTKIPNMLRMYEMELRNIIQEKLQRGTIEATIHLIQHGTNKPLVVNVELAKYYYNAVQQIATELKLESKDILNSLIRMPEIVSPNIETIPTETWKKIEIQLLTVCNEVNNYRTQEGAKLTTIIIQNINAIKNYLQSVAPFESKRIEKIKEKLFNTLSDSTLNITIDKNRLEQELIYYIEKFDISEEKNRLSHHCDYFLELLQQENLTKGKKLGFVLQEMGREINTLGAKANDADIQKVVILMKDELEQAKEQILNII